MALVAPAVAAADGTEAAIASDAEATATVAEAIDVEDLVFPEGSRWIVVEDDGTPTLRATALRSMKADVVTLPVVGMSVFAFTTTLEGDGTITFTIDGESAGVMRAGVDTPMQVQLDEGAHELSWIFQPGATSDEARLTLQGATTLLPPRLKSMTDRLAGCTLPPIRLEILHPAQLDPGNSEITWDGARLPFTIESVDVGLTLQHTIRAEAPPVTAEGASDHKLALSVRDATGKAWDVGEWVVETVIDLGIVAGPQGWVYDRSPAVFLSSSCLWDPLVEVSFTLDGEDRTADLEHGLTLRTFRFEGELEYEEEHTWGFTMRLPGGYEATRSGSFIEGLDVIETYVKTVLSIKADVRGATLVEMTSPLDGSSTKLDLGVRLSRYISLEDGAQIRALYAPRALLCTGGASELGVPSKGACAPYGGKAPGFERHLGEATLTYTREGSAPVHVAAFGQLYAAKHLSGEGHADASDPLKPIGDAGTTATRLTQKAFIA